MRVVITGGPSSEPIDRVRTLTNYSSGELAVKLSDRFRNAGNEVELFLGAGATWRTERARYFRTNEDLEILLTGVQRPGAVDVVLHAAALSDFSLGEITVIGGDGDTAKISSDVESIQIRLVPKSKLIHKLRDLFPNAYVVGWKFELDGTRDQAVKKGIKQLERNRTDACIINGEAFGEGFGFCTEKGLVHAVPNRDELADFLVHHLSEEKSGF
jgi:phosphopantothenoylcysteine synthetase/decarboxylase